MWYWYMNRQKDQWNRIESPETDKNTLENWVHTKGTNPNHWSKNGILKKMVLGEKAIWRGVHLDPYLTQK